MADSRNLTFGVQFDADAASLDELNEKQRQTQQEAEETAEELSQVGTSLTDIGARASGAFQEVSGAGAKMGTTVRGAMLESIKSGNSLSKTLSSGIGAAVTGVQAKFKGWGAATKSVARDVGNAFQHPMQTIKATLGGALQSTKKRTEDVGTEAVRSGEKLNDMGKKGKSSGEGLIGTLKKVAAAAGALLVIQGAASAVKDFGLAAIDAAANAEETTSKFETVFKDASDDAKNWAENFGKAANRSKNEIMGFMADSGALFSGLGMASEDASVMSEMMTSLSYDLASFNNLADEDAFNKLRSGIMGETEGLKSMGIVLNETALAQSMLDMGIKGSFSELDEATKVQVRFNSILAQTGDAQQDVTRTSGSYTNSLKGIKGIWADFLADAGAKFTPVLTQLFNTIMEAWPTIEPMLMQLVDLLADGLSQAIPILIQLGSRLLPIFCDALSLIFTVLQPLIPIIGQFAATLLPPLVSLISMLCSSLLPPIMQILTVICNDVLMPLMPMIITIAQAILPPIARLLGLIAPILQGLAPVLQIIGQLLTVVANVIGTIIGWVADGVGAVVNFFGNLFGGAKEASAGMDELADSTSQVASAIPDMGAIKMPAIEIPDTSAYETSIQSAMDTAPIVAEDSWNAAKETAGSGLKEIGTTASDTYSAMADQAEDAWKRMEASAAASISSTIKQLHYLQEAGSGIAGTQNTEGVPKAGAVSTPVLEPPDTSVYKDSIRSAMDDALNIAKEGFAAAKKAAGAVLEEIGTAASDTYSIIVDQAEDSWKRMENSAASSISSTIAQLHHLKSAISEIGTITVGASGVAATKVPGHARGTDNFEGGLTRINEEGGEMAILPSGSKIIPADQTDNIINASRHSHQTVFAPHFQIVINGNAGDEEKQQMKQFILQTAQEAYRQMKEDENAIEAIQASLL